MFIRTKLLTIFLSITIISILIVGVISYFIIKNNLMITCLSSLENIADIKVKTIESFFFEREADVKTVQGYYNIKTNLPIVTRFSNDRLNPVYIAAKKMLDDQLKIFQKAYRYEDFMLVNSKGKIVYVTNESHVAADLDLPLSAIDNRAFEEGRKGIYFSDIYNSQTIEGHFEMLIAAPIHDFNNIFIGVIAIQVEMEHIYNFIQDTTGLGKTGETLIGKDRGDSALFLNQLRHDKESALKRVASYEEKTAYPMKEAVKGKNGAGISVDYRGEKIIAAWRHIPILKWGLVAKIDIREAFAPIYYLSNMLIIVLGLLTVSVIISSFFFAKSLSKPIVRLTRKAGLIASGDLTSKVDIKSKDEIGLLANSFNIMIQSLNEAQEELIRKERFAAIGRISGSIAHDIRHPLSTIKTAAFFLNMTLNNKSEKTKKHLKLIDSEVTRANGIITALMRIMERKGTNKSKLIINEYIKEFFSGFPLPERIKLKIELDSKCPVIMADRLQLRQVFTNIVSNAVRAMSEKGTLTVKTKLTQKQEPCAQRAEGNESEHSTPCSELEGNFVEIYFTDNGCGTKKENLEKIFQPFYTTRSSGLGLGMSLAKDIVELNDGIITVESEDGKGSTFMIIFPAI